MRTDSESAINEINVDMFLKEFSYSNILTKNLKGEIEIADSIVLINRNLIVFQIKERSTKFSISNETEEKWFKKKVLKHAKKQICNSLNVIRNGELVLYNNRGDSIKISDEIYDNIYNVIVFQENSFLPFQLTNMGGIESSKVGFIHLISIANYKKICSKFLIPMEMLKYLNYRKEIFQSSSNPMIERELIKTYINLNKFEQKKPAILSIMKNFKEDMLHDEHLNLDYYLFLEEIMKLNATEMDEFSSLLIESVFNSYAKNNKIVKELIYNRNNVGFIFLNFSSKHCEDTLEKLMYLMCGTFGFENKLHKVILLGMVKENKTDVKMYVCYLDKKFEKDIRYENFSYVDFKENCFNC